MTSREQCLGVIDGRHEGEKLELIYRENESGAGEVQLRLLAWGEGIGWYCQRTLPLPRDLACLRVLLRRAERFTRGRSARTEAGARILPLPRVGTWRPARPASASPLWR